MLRVCRNKDNGVGMKKIWHPVFIILLVILSATLVSCGLRGGAVHGSVDVARAGPSQRFFRSRRPSLDRGAGRRADLCIRPEGIVKNRGCSTRE